MSAGLPAYFVPIIVITELAASLMLLTASVTMAMECEAIPTNALNAESRTLTATPVMPVRTIVLLRLSAEIFEPSAVSFIKIILSSIV